MSRLLFVAYFLEAGLLLVVVPWSTFWERNFFVDALPLLGPIARNYFVRGAVSGVGLVSVCAGLAELASLMRRRGRAW